MNCDDLIMLFPLKRFMLAITSESKDICYLKYLQYNEKCKILSL